MIDEATKTAIDRVLLLCDRGNTACEEFRRWRSGNPTASILDCLAWAMDDRLGEYTEALTTESRIEADVANPADAFLSDHMDVYTLDTTVVATLLTQLEDEGHIEADGKRFAYIAIQRQSSPHHTGYSDAELALLKAAIENAPEHPPATDSLAGYSDIPGFFQSDTSDSSTA